MVWLTPRDGSDTLRKIVNIPQAFEHARERHRSGRLPEADALYRQILAAEPHHAAALHMLGVLAGQTGRSDDAVNFIQQAIFLKPDHAEAHKNLGIALRATGKMEAAIAAFRQAIALQPDYAEVHKNLGSALYHNGRLDEAIASYRRAIALKPDFSEALSNLGVALRENGQLDDAVASCRRAIALKPDQPDFHNNLGNALHDKGQPEEAIASYRTALLLKPDFAVACNNLGVALKAAGQTDEAIAAFRAALRLKPDYAEACNHLGSALQAEGRLDEAVAAYRKAIALKPDCADAFGNLGHALKSQDRHDEAAAAYRRAIALKPDSPDWQHVLAALTGEHSPTTTPASYVRKLFDPYARDFDAHLVGQLHYRVPEQMLDAVLCVAPGRQFDILDLGCGTGLCGVAFRAHAKVLTGVDLSPGMIAQAGARGIYGRLITGDLAEAMQDEEESCDLVLAGDLFVYVGDLSDVFRAVARTLRSGGLFAFSLEQHDGAGFVLHSKVRFAHSLGYIRGLSESHGFTERHVREIAVRKSGADDVPGWIVVLQKASHPAACE